MKKPCSPNKSRRFANGGVPDPFTSMGATELAQYTNDPDALNAATSRDIAARDAATQGIRGPGTGYQSYSGAPSAIARPAIGQPDIQSAVSNGIKDAFKPAAPAETTFQQDINARANRINSLSNSLKPKPLVQAAFADGGKIDPEELMRRMASKYGTTGAAQAAPQPTPQPVQQAQPQAKPQGIVGGVIGALSGRKEQLEQQERKALGYANGGKIQGPGTPTSDDIDAEVVETKEPIKVSTGERIVSHAQGQLLERVAKGIGYKSLDDLLEAGTGKPVGPTIKGGKVAAEDGGLVNRAWYAGTDSRDERSGLEMERERRASAPASVLANDPVKSALVYGVVGQGQKQQPASDANYGNEGRSVPKLITNESQRTVSVPGASIVQAATQPIDNTRQPDLTTKDVLPGGYLDRGAGIVAQRGGNGRLNVTNVGTEGLTDPAKKIVDGSESALIDQKNSTYNPAAQLQRMQALRLTTDVTDPSITDPAVRENAIKGLSLIQAAQAGERAHQANQVDMQGKKLANQQAQVMADLQGQAIAGDADALKTINALNGKGLDNDFKIGNIEQTNPDGSKSSVPVRITRNGAEVVDGKQQKPVTSKDEVAKAIATGRITKEQAAKRLADAGLNPKDYGL